MGDMGEMFREMKADRKEFRTLVATTNIALMKEQNLRFVETQPGVWRWCSNQGTVIYWPSSNKWNFRGKVFKGSVTQLKTWMQKRGFIK